MTCKTDFTIKDPKIEEENGTQGRGFAAEDGESALIELASRRKAVWGKKKSVYTDRQICKENADIILDTPHLCKAVIKKPYLLIECCFSLVNKSKEDAPFIFNRVQRDFIEKLSTFGSGRPYFILKGRQQGFTTLITAIQLAYAIVRKNFSGFTVADRDDNVKTIFLDKAKMMYSRLPKRLKPTERFNSANELYFDKLNSSIRVACASENVGRSRTLSFVHYSEASFFKCSLAALQRSIQESLVPDAICVYETTAKGFGEVKELWDSGICINLFYGWWLSDEYESSTPPDKTGDGWLRERLLHLRSMGLKEEKLNWYAKKYFGYIDKSSIRQEYPCSPEEAFISGGESIFSTDDISEYLKEDEIPYTCGYFSYDKEAFPVLDGDGRVLYYSMRITNVRFTKDEGGFIKIVYPPYKKEVNGIVEEKPYVIGADTAGTGSDYFSAKVIDNTNGICVATLHKQKMDEDLFSEQLYCLGVTYNNALIAVETNYSRHPMRVLRNLGYVNLYSAGEDALCGFVTSSITRPLIIANLVSVMRENIRLETDRATLYEMLDFIKHPSGRAEAASGKHDDLVMASAIARYVAADHKSSLTVYKKDFFSIKNAFKMEDTDQEKTYMEW